MISTETTDRIKQGDIFKNIDFVESYREKDGIIQMSKIEFPYVAVVSQDCDLEHDNSFRWEAPRKKTQDKWLFSVMVVPLYNKEHFIQGEHLSNLRMQMANYGGTALKIILQNNNPRYHFLDFPDDIPIVPSIVDFKHYFTVNVSYLRSLKDTNWEGSITPLFREDMCLRFANYLSRIGLPV